MITLSRMYSLNVGSRSQDMAHSETLMLDSGLDWTMDWTQLWTHKEDAETVSMHFTSMFKYQQYH